MVAHFVVTRICVHCGGWTYTVGFSYFTSSKFGENV
jgi:hypothetical protein